MTVATSGARRTIRTTETYREAERTVDWLSDHGFDVAGMRIVGSGLRSVEEVSGRLTTGRAAGLGAAQGAMSGLFFGLLIGLFFTVDGGGFLAVVAYGLIVGALFGAAFGAALHYARGGRRDFASAVRTEAATFEVQVDDGAAGAATELLVRMPGTRIERNNR
jgi:hypothetical protein